MAAKKTAKKKTFTRAQKGSGPSKSDFVREKLKAGMSAADIVKAGAEQKIVIAPSMVYKLKSKLASGGGKKKTSSKGGSKKKAGKGSASAFVRKYPTKSANEIVELAKKAGVKVNAGLVYTTRAYDKKKGGSKKKPGPKAKTPVFQVFKGGGGAGEEQFKTLLAQIGIARATELIEEAASWGRVFGVVK